MLLRKNPLKRSTFKRIINHQHAKWLFMFIQTAQREYDLISVFFFFFLLLLLVERAESNLYLCLKFLFVNYEKEKSMKKKNREKEYQFRTMNSLSSIVVFSISITTFSIFYIEIKNINNIRRTVRRKQFSNNFDPDTFINSFSLIQI